MSRKRTLLALAAVATTMVAWALLAPPERQLGEGIRLVYLHVAATWAGLLGIYLAGLMGLHLAITPNRLPEGWTPALATGGLILFTVGLVLSLASARVSWGGILWEEPRLLASFGIVALGAVVWWMTRGMANIRWRGLAWAIFATVSAVSLQAAELFFHPDAPIATSTSGEIRLTFYGLFALAVIAAGLIVFMLLPTNEPEQPEE